MNSSLQVAGKDWFFSRNRLLLAPARLCHDRKRFRAVCWVNQNVIAKRQQFFGAGCCRVFLLGVSGGFTVQVRPSTEPANRVSPEKTINASTLLGE